MGKRERGEEGGGSWRKNTKVRMDDLQIVVQLVKPSQTTAIN